MANCTTTNDCCLLFKGKVFIARRSNCCPAFKDSELRFIGNVTELNIDQTTNKITQKDFTSAGGGSYCSYYEIEEANLAMTVGCADRQVLEIAGAGPMSVLDAGAPIVGEIHHIKANDKAITSLMIDLLVPVIVTDPATATVYVLDVDYTVDAYGITVIAGSALETDILASPDEILEITIDYTHSAQETLKGLSSTGGEYYMVIEGENTQVNGQLMKWVFPRIRFSPAASISIFQEEFSTFEIEGELLNDGCSDEDCRYTMTRLIP